MRKARLAVLFVGPLAACAAAEDGPSLGTGRGALFALPAGCEAFVTVQRANCRVTHHFTCEADPAGWQRFAWFDGDGLTLAGVQDGEAQLLKANYLVHDRAERLLPGSADPTSMTELLATGRDRYDFRTESAEVGQTRYVGEDRLTGEWVMIDGVTLERTAFAYVAYDALGREAWRQEGSQLASREWRMLFQDRDTTRQDGELSTLVNPPVEFAGPGEEGFLSLVPRFGCGEALP